MEAAFCPSFRKWFHMAMKTNNICQANSIKEKELWVAVVIQEWAIWALDKETLTQIYMWTSTAIHHQCQSQVKTKEATNICMEHLDSHKTTIHN